MAESDLTLEQQRLVRAFVNASVANSFAPWWDYSEGGAYLHVDGFIDVLAGIEAMSKVKQSKC